MTLGLLLFGVPILAATVVAAAAPGRRFVAATLVVIVLACVGISLPLPPPSGPDDWFRGAGRLTATMTLIAACVAIPLQLVRWARPVSPWLYWPGQAVLVALALIFYLSTA